MKGGDETENPEAAGSAHDQRVDTDGRWKIEEGRKDDETTYI